MKSTLALVAMATVATANASAPDAVFANAMAFAKDTRMLLDANNGRRVLASAPSASSDGGIGYMKGKCVKGQATDIASFKAEGLDLLIPTAGFCMNTGNASMLLTCDGVTLNMQQDDKDDCKQITKDTAKADVSKDLGPCLTGEVQGVHVDMYQKSDCSGTATTIVLASDACMGGDGDYGKFVCKGDKITAAEYGDSKCAKDAKKSVTFTSGDGKCHGLKKETPGSSAPAPAPGSSASSVALTAGIAFAGLIASLALM